MATPPAYGGQQFPASPGAVSPHRSLWVLWHMHTIQFFFRGLWCSIYLSISHQLHIREMKDSEQWSPCPARAYISLRVWECPWVSPTESHWVEEAVAEVLRQVTEPWSMSQELTLLLEQSGASQSHFSGAITLVISTYFTVSRNQLGGTPLLRRSYLKSSRRNPWIHPFLCCDIPRT